MGDSRFATLSQYGFILVPALRARCPLLLPPPPPPPPLLLSLWRTTARISAPSFGHIRRTYGLHAAVVFLPRQILATTLPTHCCFSQPAGAVTTGSAPRVSVFPSSSCQVSCEHRPGTLELAGGLTGYAAR